jgi:acyl dehydratase
MSIEQVREQLTKQLGQEVHLSEWLTITQARIDAFAAATGDNQWIHVNPERAAAESPWRSTIAHGFLTLSLVPYLRGLVDPAKPSHPGVRTVINYGLNKLRFTNAVRVGAEIRSRSVLLAFEEFKGGGIQITEQVTIEIQGESKPACVAELVLRLYF